MISVLNRFYVPVYTANEDYARNGSAPAEEKAENQRIFREFLDRKLGTGSVHVYLLSPDGRGLGGLDIGSATQTEKLLAALEKTARELRTAPGDPVVRPASQSSAPFSYREDAVLHLTARGFNRGSWREFPAENWIVLPRREWMRLLPPVGAPVAAGQMWEVEPKLVTRLYHRFHPQTEDTTDDIARNRIEEQRLTGVVRSIQGDRVIAWFTGRLRMKRPFYPGRDDPNQVDAEIGGFAEFDGPTRRLLDFQLITEQATYGKEGFGVAVRTARAPRPELPVGQEQVLFDFESGGAIADWKPAPPEPGGETEPTPRLTLEREHARSGRQSLRITFQGGHWPGVETTRIPEDWSDFASFRAEVTVARSCLVGFQAMQERSSTARGWDGGVSRWVKTELLRPGTTTVRAPLHPNDWSALRPELGRVVSFRIFLYRPALGEAIHVDHLRLTTTPEPVERPRTAFRVLGTDLTVENVQDLGKQLKEQWKPPMPRTVAEIEADMRLRLAEARRSHPNAVLAVLRDGERGYDPAHPDRVYDGWRDAYWSSHGPDGLTRDREENLGRAATQEVFMRHRSPLMRVDLESIPRGSHIVEARLVLVREKEEYDPERHPLKNPNMWVAEPCLRPWVETEVNAYEYARGAFWKAVGGMHWGDDPDFAPQYVAYGPGGGKVSAWDFTGAVRYWNSGERPNHGFMLHCDAYDWFMSAWTREAPERTNRPALLVIYAPRTG